MPQSVSISNTLGQGANTYMYAADGRKLQAVIGSKQTDYVGNVIYENGSLKRILIDGGYIEGGAYYFYLTDHLGNNRVVANANGGIVQTNHYYPFGMSFAEGVSTSKQPYKYNGKELDTEKGLNLYDYSARLMNPVLGRFSTMDPLGERGYASSPYVYCQNNPLLYIDPDGLWKSIAGGYETDDIKDIEQFLSYYQSEEAVSKQNPDMNQILSFIGKVTDGEQATLSDGSYLLSDVSMNKTTSSQHWTADEESLSNVWNEVANIRSGKKQDGGNFWYGMSYFAGAGGVYADVAKATGSLGSIGVWRDYSKMRYYSSGWTGSGTVKTFGAAGALGYGMYGLSLLSDVMLYRVNKQSGFETGLNIGINTLMIRMPLQISIPFAVGSTAKDIQQSAFNRLIKNGYGDNSGLFNTDFLH